jgi:hypothetical protein
VSGQQTSAAQGYSEYLQSGPPLLRITNNGVGSVRLVWTPMAIKLMLEQQTKLQSSNWTTISIPPRAAGNDFSYTLTMTNATGFFRLH